MALSYNSYSHQADSKKVLLLRMLLLDYFPQVIKVVNNGSWNIAALGLYQYYDIYLLLHLYFSGQPWVECRLRKAPQRKRGKNRWKIVHPWLNNRMNMRVRANYRRCVTTVQNMCVSPQVQDQASDQIASIMRDKNWSYLVCVRVYA